MATCLSRLANDNRIIRYKGRRINYKRPVLLYRNVRRVKGRWYSIRQNGLVVAHATRLCLKDCRFLINEAGRKQMKKRGEKTVHAFIEGVITGSGMGCTAKDAQEALPVKVAYDPKKDERFHSEGFTRDFEIKSAEFVAISERGVFAAYVN